MDCLQGSMTSEPTSAFRLLTDHEEIKRWAERKGAIPSCVRGSGGMHDVGTVQFAYRGNSNEDLEPISWDEFFAKFDAKALAIFARTRPS